MTVIKKRKTKNTNSFVLSHSGKFCKAIAPTCRVTRATKSDPLLSSSVTLQRYYLLLVKPVVLVGHLGRTERSELAELRRELDVRRQRMRRKNLPGR